MSNGSRKPSLEGRCKSQNKVHEIKIKKVNPTTAITTPQGETSEEEVPRNAEMEE